MLALHVFVIVWGAFVRISFSGDGCGNHWPLCNGEMVPTAPTVHTLIEFSHRATSGLAVLSVALLVLLVRRDHVHIRRAAYAALFFDGMEAVIGMALVKLRLVGDNPSMKRALSGSLHLVNTFFLLAALALVVLFLSRDGRREESPKAKRPRGLTIGLGLGAVSLLAIAMSGAVAAFGDTLYRVATLRQAIEADFSGTSALLLRLRVFHPALALGGGVFVFGLAVATRWLRPESKNVARTVMALLACQVVLGLANVLLLAPAALQLAHLLVAQGLWISYVLMSGIALGARPLASTSTDLDAGSLASSVPEAESITV